MSFTTHPVVTSLVADMLAGGGPEAEVTRERATVWTLRWTTPRVTAVATVAVRASGKVVSRDAALTVDGTPCPPVTGVRELLAVFEDLSTPQQDALRLVARHAVGYRAGILPGHHVNASVARALVRRNLLTKHTALHKGYKLSTRGAAMTAAVGASRIVHSDPRQVALEFVARGRVSVRREFVDGFPALMWLLDGERVSARKRHLLDLWQTAYVTVPGLLDDGFTGAPVVPTDEGYALRTAWLEEHGSPFPHER